jgi:DNA (cytosine-5)-methyltransferase 1
MRHGSLFSGIGGFDLAAEWMGWENVFHCEMNPFGRQVLNYYWPNSISYDDITKTDFTIHRGTIDILTGGFPCQPYSHAGKRLGKEDERHLWPEMLRAIREIQPTWVVGENVSGLISWNGGLVFHEVQTDLEAEGYEVQPFVLPACAVNAPHRRDLVWFIAYNNSFIRGAWGNDEPGKQPRHGKSILPITATRPTTNPDGTEPRNDIGENIGTEREIRGSEQGDVFGELRSDGPTTNPASQGREEREPNNRRKDSAENRAGMDDRPERFGNKWIIADTNLSGCKTEREQPIPTAQNKRISYSCSGWDRFPTQPPVCSRNDGLSAGLVGITVSKHRNESIKAYGNAIVPQVALQIFKAIAYL